MGDMNNDPVLVTFRQKYHGCSSFAEANEYLTTANLYAMLKQSAGELNFDVKQLEDWLLSNGYTQDFIEGTMTKVWLLKRDD